MGIINVNKIVGERVVLSGLQMVWGDVILFDDWTFQFYLCDRYDPQPTFEIVLNTKLWALSVKDIHNNYEHYESINKKDVSNIQSFSTIVIECILKLPVITSYLSLLAAIQNDKMKGVGITPASHSFSHLSGSLGQPINPNKKRFLSKGTAKMPVTMSIDDDEVW